MKLIDLTGQKFGRLTALRRGETINKRTRWVCSCECGKEITVEANNLKTGHTISCGCVQRERTSEANKTHGMRSTRLYRVWNDMKNRCYRQSYHAFNHYGGRGIKVCDEWLNDFQAFYNWAIANGYQVDLTIDRINSNGNYCPENCRWATMAEQNENKRAKNGYRVKE